MLSTVFIGLGSNLGNREKNIFSFVSRLGEIISDIRLSSLYETDPVGFTEQPVFLNAVCKGNSRVPPAELLQFLLDVEKELGRVRTFKWGPRIIDADLLLYDDLITETPELILPHPRMLEREFVLVPLLEIAPEAFHPVEKMSIKSFLKRFSLEKLDLKIFQNSTGLTQVCRQLG
ncbi:MAG: 2-amino-4-hydroxy-6-hydroxymethyldihydropteridine diphosphokinase [Candidatus Riflebacteria bacterium]|nr:2-amino-4-hydroxy-6-hydroxymethyldihydropteridine diphosphokinase [Candidatus Riflebacteria bacterium]